MNFSDYENIFNNFSVPVSCCNTTNPLANETTCPDIVMDITNVTTELIYTEVHHCCSVIIISTSSSYLTAGLCSSVTVLLSLYSQCCCWSWYHYSSNTNNNIRDISSCMYSWLWRRWWWLIFCAICLAAYQIYTLLWVTAPLTYHRFIRLRNRDWKRDHVNA